MTQLRNLPAVDIVLSSASSKLLLERHGVQTVRDEIRSIQGEMRTSGQVPGWASEAENYAAQISQRLKTSAYTPVFNLTGTVIHTNLGRALLSNELWHNIAPLVTRPMNLEYDLDRGQRGSRDKIVATKLQRLTGCQAATIVNNNAAALLLVLNTFALGKKVPVSRGELIEIGGSFRLPELMSRAGCELVEIGTTNRTHEKDYVGVLPDAALLLKVHPSNYHIQGFSAQVNAAELAELATQQGIPSCVDLGSGTLVDLTRWQLPAEPTPQSVLDDGIDLVTFSGDKLLGGVQAGIIVGNSEMIAQLNANPLKRALRADKITMAILEATLKLYEDPEQLPTKLPLLKMLLTEPNELQQRAQRCIDALPSQWQCEVQPSQVQIGSGALPDQTIDSLAVCIHHAGEKPQSIEAQLRRLPTPVIGRIANDRIWLDMRGATPMDDLVLNLQNLSGNC